MTRFSALLALSSLALPAAVAAQTSEAALPSPTLDVPPAPAREHTQGDTPPSTSIDLEVVLRGEGRGLTAAQAATLAEETAPSVDRARAAAQQATAGAQRALYSLIPQLALGLRYTRLSRVNQGSISFGGGALDPELIPAVVAPVSDPAARELWRQLLTAQAESASFEFPQVLDQFGLNMQLSYPLSDALLTVWPAYEGAQHSAEAQALREASVRADVGLSAREAFYNYARARAALAVARTSAEQAESRLEQVRAFVAAGTAAAVDELRVRAQAAAARVAVSRAEAGVTMGASALRTLLHLESGVEVAVGEDLLAPLPPLPGTATELIGQALQARNDMRALRRLTRATERQVDAAEGSRYPHLILRANLDVANPNPRVFPQTAEFRESWDLSAVLTWSPHDLLNGEQQANEARAQRAQVQADVRQLEDGIRLQVNEAFATYAAAREGLEAARLGVEAGDETYRVQTERYRAGVSTLSDVIDASAEQLRARLDLVNSAIDARLAWARLQRRIGAEP